MNKINVELRRMNRAVNFVAKNGEGCVVSIDGPPALGGQELGLRPMQLALAALAACASIDIGPILAKQRQELSDIRVSATGERDEGTPSPFRSVNLHFDLYGRLDEKQVRKALDLAVHKYCSVGAMLQGNVEISWSVELHADTAPPRHRV